jgi:hypothetical protein
MFRFLNGCYRGSSSGSTTSPKIIGLVMDCKRGATCHSWPICRIVRDGPSWNLSVFRTATMAGDRGLVRFDNGTAEFKSSHHVCWVSHLTVTESTSISPKATIDWHTSWVVKTCNRIFDTSACTSLPVLLNDARFVTFESIPPRKKYRLKQLQSRQWYQNRDPFHSGAL